MAANSTLNVTAVSVPAAFMPKLRVHGVGQQVEDADGQADGVGDGRRLHLRVQLGDDLTRRPHDSAPGEVVVGGCGVGQGVGESDGVVGRLGVLADDASRLLLSGEGLHIPLHTTVLLHLPPHHRLGDRPLHAGQPLSLPPVGIVLPLPLLCTPRTAECRTGGR